MRILFVSSEVAPFAKAGGLADVSHCLPKALAALGHEVHVVTPMYRQAEKCGILSEFTGRTVRVPISHRTEEARLYRSRIGDSVTVHLIRKDELYNRSGLYGNEYGDYEDNAERFIFFSRAVPELCLELDINPQIIHCNDWQTGLTPLYLKSLYRDVPRFKEARSVFTIHNLGNQGIFWSLDMHLTGLGWEYFTIDGIEFHGHINLMKAGIIFADRITTVSHKYADEILTPELGFGLDGVVTSRRRHLSAVLHGVDYERWDPSNDPCIPANYGVVDSKPKALCKEALVKRHRLDSGDSGPVVAMISRLVNRKGFDLLAEVFDRLIAMGLRFIIMGKGEDRYHGFLEKMSEKYPGRLAVSMPFDDEEAHRIQAGADIFLNPAKYEPCGLDQLYGLRYGTIPVVRATGGLDETIEEYDPDTGMGTGFKFREYSGGALAACLEKAVGFYGEQEHWERLMKNAMEKEFSWESSAREYERIYESTLKGV